MFGTRTKNALQAGLLPPGMQKVARILSIVLVFANIGLFGLSWLLALGSLFLFDAPNSWNSILAQIMFWSMFISPCLIGIATFAAIWLQERGKYVGVALITFLAMLYFMFIFLLLSIPK